jgi:proline iminopeptidase
MARTLGRSRGRATSGFTEGAGARIWYRTLGRGEPVVLLHGGPGADHTDFLPYLAPLARRFRLVLFDQRGCGQSERLADTRRYSLKGMVADVKRCGSTWVLSNGMCWGIPSAAFWLRPTPCDIRAA